MGDVAIKKKPTVQPSSVSAPKRDNMKFTVTWKVPSEATSGKRNDRWTGISYRWSVFYYDPITPKTTKGYKAGGEWKKKRVIKQVSVKTTSATFTLDRNDFWPVHKWRHLQRVEFLIYGRNAKGHCKEVITKYTFSAPPSPSLSMSVNDNTQALETTITNSEQTSGVTNERFQTLYRVYRQDSTGVTAKNTYLKKTKTWERAYNTKNSANVKFVSREDIGIQQQLNYGQWVEIFYEAVNRGVHGNSTTTKASHVFAYPAKATIQKIVLSNAKNPLDPTGSVAVWLKTNNSAKAPVDKVQLQRLRNSDAETTAKAAIDSGWSDVDGAVDNANCQGLSDNATNAIPDVGKHTWYRIKSTHDNLTSYSTPVEATAFFRKEATAEDDTVTILNVNGDRDGTSIEVALAWKNDDSTGTEISWAEYEDAWKSTNQPSTYRVDWEDDNGGKPIVAVDNNGKNISYDKTATVIIRGLTESTKYYIKARRYAVGESGTETFGKYNAAPQQYWPTSTGIGYSGAELKDVQLYVQQPIIRGRDTSASWVFDSDDPQSGWELHAIRLVPEYSDSIIAQGTDSMTSTVIKSDIFQDDADLAFRLRMTTGGDWVENSNDVGTAEESNRIKIFDYPDDPVFGAYRLTRQPFGIYLVSDTGTDDYIFTMRSLGVSKQDPDGVTAQAEGDVVFSNRISPNWSAKASGGFKASVTFPERLDIIDGSMYALESTVIDTSTELRSVTRTSVIIVDWEHKALPPATSSTITANPNSKTVTITPQAPEGAADTDVVDIYRVTPDGAQIIASDVVFGYSVTDRWAPYSKSVPLCYRIALRTVDQDTEFLDIPYNLNGYAIRFDWAGDRSLEIPYNLKYSDSYTKDFEERAHMNGEHAGYWNEGRGRTNSMSTQLVRLEDPEQVALVRELAQYAGAVFVRLPNACSFMANVTVDGLDTNYDSLVLDVSFTATEVILTDEFRVAASDIVRN